MTYNIANFLMKMLVLLFSLSVHECSHGLASYLLGDKQAKDDGRISLNPIRHIDLLGFVFILVLGFGWAKPVMINPQAYKRPKLGTMISAAAGPVSNFVLAFLSLLIFMAFNRSEYGNGDSVAVYMITTMLTYGVFMNLGLGLFNLIPLPPLDGSKVFSGFLPNDKYFKFIGTQNIITIIALVLMISTSAVSYVLTPAINGMIEYFSYICSKIL
ncbi:peptidase [Clostridia bacterium]|nr:peptidase [Clostridia bacterium]